MLRRVRSRRYSISRRGGSQIFDESYDVEDEKDEEEDTDFKDIGTSIETEDEPNGEEDAESEYDKLEQYQNVINVLDLDALAVLAVATRKRYDLSMMASKSTSGSSLDINSCVVDPTPATGSYNLVYFLEFPDGLKWVTRVPGKGPAFDDVDRRKMDSDYNTLKHIQKTTCIPGPEVFRWSTSSDELGAPYALMSFLKGVALCERWVDLCWATEARRFKALTDIASAMSQLYNTSYSEIGCLDFHGDGQDHKVGPTFWQEESDNDPWGTVHVSGPWQSTKEYLLYEWDLIEKEVVDKRKAHLAILRLAIESIPDFMTENESFHLEHHDLNYQNIFVDDDANITGIIDWDGSRTVPSSMGFGRCPSWITRDWDPAMYGYYEEEDPPYDPLRESPPDQLHKYRQHYAAAFEALELPGYYIRQTSLSHIMEAISIARNDLMCRDWIIPKILEHAFRHEMPFTLEECEQAYLAGRAKGMMEKIGEAFELMWESGWTGD